MANAAVTKTLASISPSDSLGSAMISQDLMVRSATDTNPRDDSALPSAVRLCSPGKYQLGSLGATGDWTCEDEHDTIPLCREGDG